MASVYINSTKIQFLSIGDITDSLTANESNFSLELPNYTATNRLGQSVEVYNSNNNLLAIGSVRKESVKLSVRPKTNLEVVGYSQFLNWFPITGRFSGTIRDVINLLIIQAQLDQILLGVRFLTNSIVPETSISLSLSYQYINQALQQLLGLSGYSLTYRIPVSEKIIEINQIGFGNPAPIADFNIADLYTNCGLGVQRPIQYGIVPPIASVITVYARNGLRSIGNGNINPLDILRYTSRGENQFNTLQTADEIIKILVTQPTPVNQCTIAVVVTGSNFTQFNEAFEYDYNLPNISTDPVSLVYTADIVNVKPSSNFSFYLDGQIDTTEAQLVVTFQATEIYNQVLSAGLFGVTTVIPLTPYIGQTGQIVATLTLAAQPSTTTYYQAFIEADCCAIDTIAGTGTEGFSPDGTNRLVADLDEPTYVQIHSDGTLYFSDTGNYLIRKIETDQSITTIGGNGNQAIIPPVNGGIATDQDFGQTNSFYIDSTNNILYLILPDWNQVGKIHLDTGLYYIIKDSTDFELFAQLFGIVVDSDENVFVGDLRNDTVRKITSAGVMTIYAGIDNSSGFSGDGGIATSAQLNQPFSLAFDSDENLYIADNGNARVRKVNKSDQIINTVAGGGVSTVFGEAALNFNLEDQISQISIDQSTNDIYLLGAFNFILQIKAIDSTVNKIAGIAFAGFSGDTGSPKTAVLDASFSFSGGLYVVSNNEIYIGDSGNNRIRQIYCGDSPNL